MINWENLYNKLIETRVSDVGEKHHTIPIHAGGKNSKIVVLSRKNHILAHYIRWRWKKEIGDKCAYKIMSGQLKNPMHDEEMRKYTMNIINNMISNQDYLALKSKQIKERWDDKKSREKIIKGRRNWIEKDNNRFSLASRLNTEASKKKRAEKIKKYYENVDKLELSKRNSKKVLMLENNEVIESVILAAEHFKVSKKTICRWAKQGNKIKYIK